jgi:hypothetical protein
LEQEEYHGNDVPEEEEDHGYDYVPRERFGTDSKEGR